MEITDIGTIIAIIISLGSLIIVLYKDFWQGFKLHSYIDQIFFIRLPANNKSELLLNMLADNILDEVSPLDTKGAFNNHPNILDAIINKNRELLLIELVEFLKSNNPINYNPPQEIIEKYFGHKLFSCSFFLPLLIHNSGQKFAHISSLILILENVDDKSKKWAFSSFMEIDPKELLQRHKDLKDIDRISNLFYGISIAPSEKIKTNPYFTPRYEAENEVISETSITPGTYSIKIYGYSDTEKQVLKMIKNNFKIESKNLIETFMGNESGIYLNTDKSLIETLKD